MLFVLVFFSAVGILHPRYEFAASRRVRRSNHVSAGLTRPQSLPRSRKIHWDFSLNLLLVLLLIVTPLVQSFLVTRYRSSRGKSRTGVISEVSVTDVQDLFRRRVLVYLSWDVPHVRIETQEGSPSPDSCRARPVLAVDIPLHLRARSIKHGPHRHR